MGDCFNIGMSKTMCTSLSNVHLHFGSLLYNHYDSQRLSDKFPKFLLMKRLLIIHVGVSLRILIRWIVKIQQIKWVALPFQILRKQDNMIIRQVSFHQIFINGSRLQLFLIFFKQRITGNFKLDQKQIICKWHQYEKIKKKHSTHINFKHVGIYVKK
ncbi:unnamed protein product [Paramecium octaurelia]|uniref:Uncharacterized protein n=1 Tax=Paramecium octaurelia TaxID=43137 RepID=A0A8S1XTQ3_PAROT|nr:unnamed protein product [Paramecium octaurelia]